MVGKGNGEDGCLEAPSPLFARTAAIAGDDVEGGYGFLVACRCLQKPSNLDVLW